MDTSALSSIILAAIPAVSGIIIALITMVKNKKKTTAPQRLKKLEKKIADIDSELHKINKDLISILKNQSSIIKRRKGGRK